MHPVVCSVLQLHVRLSPRCFVDWRVRRVGAPYPDVPAPSQGVNTRMLFTTGILTGSDYESLHGERGSLNDGLVGPRLGYEWKLPGFFRPLYW